VSLFLSSFFFGQQQQELPDNHQKQKQTPPPDWGERERLGHDVIFQQTKLTTSNHPAQHQQPILKSQTNQTTRRTSHRHLVKTIKGNHRDPEPQCIQTIIRRTVELDSSSSSSSTEKNHHF
jgi:hypothetical protein